MFKSEATGAVRAATYGTELSGELGAQDGIVVFNLPRPDLRYPTIEPDNYFIL